MILSTPRAAMFFSVGARYIVPALPSLPLHLRFSPATIHQSRITTP